MDGIGRQFIDMTKYANMGDAPYRKGAVPPPLARPASGESIPLPEPAAQGGDRPFLELVNQRRTLRRYAEKPITQAELSYLLWCCQGVQQITETSTMRTVPSAGARHAFETYVLCNRVEGLAPGLYRYLALEGALEVVNLAGGIADTLAESCLGQGTVAQGAVTVFWTAELMRMYTRYGERGYRYLFLDAGHACQNLYLAAESVGCGACAIGAFDDDKLNRALGLDGEERFTVYACAVGKKS
jgi:SagB-type dehydrogenase family enzyme